MKSLLALGLLAVLCASCRGFPAGTAGPLHAGLRRSSYGLPAKNADHAWRSCTARSAGTAV